LQDDLAATGTEAAAATTTDDSQLIELLEEQNAILAETVAVDAAQTSALAAMLPTLPSYDTGGPILSDQIARVHEGEYVVPKGGALVSGSSDASKQGAIVNTHVHVHGDASNLIRVIRSEITNPTNVMAVSRQIGRRSQLLSHSVR